MEQVSAGYYQEGRAVVEDVARYRRDRYGSHIESAQYPIARRAFRRCNQSEVSSRNRTADQKAASYTERPARTRNTSQPEAAWQGHTQQQSRPSQSAQRPDYTAPHQAKCYEVLRDEHAESGNYNFATYQPETARNPHSMLRLFRTAIIIAACIGLVAFSGWRVLTGNLISGTESFFDTSHAANTSPTSTPSSEWRQGSLPYLYQTDPAWSQTPYAGSTIGVAGCGPTCLSMVAISLTGRRDLDPKSMAAFSESNGYVTDGLTSWSLLTSGAATFGLTGEEIPAEPTMVHRLLEQGYPIIASMTPGDFTSEGHFIVLAGIASDGSSIVVHDPNSPERSAQTWTLDTILSQAANLWAYSMA